MGRSKFFNVVLIAFSIFVPFACILAFLVQIRNAGDKTLDFVIDSSKHGTLVGVVLTGTSVSFVILAVDILASLAVIRNRHEYSEYISNSALNLRVIFVHTIWVILTNFFLLLCFLYIVVCSHLIPVCCGKRPCHKLVSALVVLVVGRTTFEKIGQHAKHPTVSAVFLIMLGLPFISVSPHLGYILIAWLSESSKFNASLVLFYIILIILVVIFRKCYTSHSTLRFSCCQCKKLYGDRDTIPQGSRDIELGKVESDSEDSHLDHLEKKGGSSELERTPLYPPLSLERAKSRKERIFGSTGCITFDKSVTSDINTHAFSLLIFYGVFILMLTALIILTIVMLPFTAGEFITYFVNIVQLIIVFAASKYLYSGGSFSAGKLPMMMPFQAQEAAEKPAPSGDGEEKDGVSDGEGRASKD